MKSGRNLIELATELQRQKERKVDFVAPTKDIAVEVVEGVVEDKPSKSLALVGGPEQVGITDLALQQIAERTEIPIKYVRKMQATQPELLARNINTWFQAKSERQLIRVLDGKARAFLSDRYQRIDNFDVAETALEAFGNLPNGGLEVRSTEVTENRLYIKATFPGLQREIKSVRGQALVGGARVGDIVEAGVMVTNSEVGQGAVSVSRYALYLWCLNGAVAEKPKRWFHIGGKIEAEELAYLSDDTLKAGDRFDVLKIRDAISAAFNPEIFEQYIAKVQGATQDQIAAASVAKGIEILGQKLQFSKAETSSILGHLIQGGDLSRYGVFNAVTRSAEDADSYDRATELEALGQSVIELPANDWRQIAEAA